MLRIRSRSRANRGYMKDINYENVEEIEITDVKHFGDQWRDRLAQSVNGKGVENSFDYRVKIVDKIDVWSINIK